MTLFGKDVAAQEYTFTVFADYFQFIEQDEKSEDDFASMWTSQALDMALAVGISAISPGTLRNVDVSVEVRILEAEPKIELAEVDHAVEASIELPSGTIVVMGCMDYFPDAPRFSVTPGTWCVLSVMTGIGSIKNEWEPANDSYLVYLWPGEKRKARLLKRWARPLLPSDDETK